MTTQKTFWGANGHYIILSYELAYKKVIAAHREGTEYDLISTALFTSQGKCIGRQAWHDTVSGRVYFDSDIPFDGTVLGVGMKYERVNIIYEL